MKRLSRYLLLICLSVFCVIMSGRAAYAAETVCSTKAEVQRELTEQLSARGISELVVTTDFKMGQKDVAEVFDEASLANGKLYGTSLPYSTTVLGGKYTYKMTLDPTSFVKVAVFKSEKKLYMACLKALYTCDFTKRFYTGDKGCYDVMYLVLKQHPEYNYSIYASKYGSLSGKTFCGFKPSEAFSKKKIQSMRKETDKKADAIIQNVVNSGMSNSDKVTALHRYVVENCVFDRDAGETAFTAYGCLVEGRAVCQGYTAAMNLLLSKCGIYSIGVAGDIISSGESHAWNYVKCDGLKYLDATWDDPVPDRGTNIITEFLLTDESYISKTHSWNKTEYSEKYINYSMKYLKKVL